MNKERLERLTWYVQFAQLKLDELKPGDRAKLSVEAKEYLFPANELKQLGIPIEILKTSTKGVEIEVQGEKIKCPPFFPDWALNVPQMDNGNFWDLISSLQRVVFNRLQILLGPRVESKGGIKYVNSFSLSQRVDTLFQIGSEENVYKFSYIPITETQKEFVELKLYMLLDGLPITTITKCQGCDGIFINTSLRKKRFCSPKCIWKVNAKKKREELKKNPEGYKAYLKKQREIMQKQYETKIRKEHPHAKIKKRKEVNL